MLTFVRKVKLRAVTTTRIIQEATSRHLWNWRCYCLNRSPAIFVSPQVAFIAKTAELQLRSSGFDLGGNIHVSTGSRLSDGVILATFGGTIYLEENVFLGPYCVLYGHGGIKIGKNTLVAGHTFIVAANHTFSDANTLIREQTDTTIGIIIGDDVWIGCGAKILDGVTIGNGCVVGAGSVVNKSLPEYSIAVGVPAKVIGNRKES